MGRAPCCDKANVKKGPWSPDEDAKLRAYIEQNGTGGNWIALPQKIGLKRCGKSCRLRWLNYLRPNIKHGGFSEEEDNIICNLYVSIGSRWSIIAAQLPGRTDNDIKNYWNTRLKKKLLGRHKQANLNGCPNASGVEENSSSHTLSNSALERLQLHMQLQSLQGPLSSNNHPALWPKLHPLQEKLLLQSLSETSLNSTLIHKQLTETCALDSSNLDNQSKKAINALTSSGSPIESFNNCNNVMASHNFPVSNNFQAELEDLLNNKTSEYIQGGEKIREFNCFKDMNFSKDSLVWWSNEIETKLASSNNPWDFTSATQPQGIFQDYELGYNM